MFDCICLPSERGLLLKERICSWDKIKDLISLAASAVSNQPVYPDSLINIICFQSWLLMLSKLGKTLQQTIFWNNFLIFFWLLILCKFSPQETVCMKCQPIFLDKIVGWRKGTLSWAMMTLFLLFLFAGHQGTGVVSYFVFLRWLFFLNFFIFLLCFWAIVFFQVAFTNADYDKDTTGQDDSTTHTGVILANTCSAQYAPNVTSDALSLVLDFIQGTVSIINH